MIFKYLLFFLDRMISYYFSYFLFLDKLPFEMEWEGA